MSIELRDALRARAALSVIGSIEALTTYGRRQGVTDVEFTTHHTNLAELLHEHAQLQSRDHGVECWKFFNEQLDTFIGEVSQ